MGPSVPACCSTMATRWQCLPTLDLKGNGNTQDVDGFFSVTLMTHEKIKPYRKPLNKSPRGSKTMMVRHCFVV